MSKRIPKKRRAKVASRALHRCEYCHSSAALALGHFHTEHILPRKYGGSDDEDNLAYACPLCNENKLTTTEGRDSATGRIVRLFNPRTDDWNSHFIWSADGIDLIGLTPIGRITVAVLKINDAKRRYLRRLWTELRLHPPETDNVITEQEGI